MENGKTKIWLGEDKIVRIKIEKDLNEKIIEKIISELKIISKSLQGKPNISIDITSSIPMPSFVLRKKIVKVVKDALQDPGFNKVAEWGITNNIIKTITIFVVGAINLKNFKYFDTEEKALAWFKEE